GLPAGGGAARGGDARRRADHRARRLAARPLAAWALPRPPARSLGLGAPARPRARWGRGAPARDGAAHALAVAGLRDRARPRDRRKRRRRRAPPRRGPRPP